MSRNSPKQAEGEKAYKVDKGFRSAKAGAAIGMVLGALLYFLLSRWLPDGLFGPIVLVTTVISAVVFGLFFPIELEYRELDDEPDSITPAERVQRLYSETKDQNKAGL